LGGSRFPRRSLRLVVEAGRGTIASGGAHTRWAWSALEGEASWTVRALLEGDAALRGAHQALPRHRLRHDNVWHPRPQFEVIGSAELRSAVLWTGYATDAPEGSGGAVTPELPAGPGFSLVLIKRLWANRIDASLTLLDLTDREVPRHPLGTAP